MTQATSKPVRARGFLFAAVACVLLSAAPLMADVVTFSPEKPNVEEQVTFTYIYKGTVTVPIRWYFGDGATYLSRVGEITAYHQYTTPGAFRVQAQMQTAGVPSPIVITTVGVVERRNLVYTPPNPTPGQPVTFQARNMLSNSLLWTFDNKPPMAGGLQMVHTFAAAGWHNASVRDWDGKSVVAISTRLLVGTTPPALVPSIAVSPAEPRAGEPVEFRAVNFTSTSLVRWDFGDGARENDTTPPVTSHAYTIPGAYTVRAYDGDAAAPTAQAVVRVWPERIITFSPADPREGEEVTFRAVNFTSPVLRWDFGDGTVVTAGDVVTHAFRTAGPWTVRAYEAGGSALASKSLSLTVFPGQGPRARFSVSFIQLRFEDGKPYKVVPRDFGSLTAFADVKFEGTGVLQAQWIVDGMPFRTVLVPLSFAGTTVLDSGRVPGLPSLIPGLHEVTLRILQPSAEFEVPVIRYFVTADAVPREAVEVQIDRALTIDGITLTGDGATIQAPVGEHFLLKGWARNESGLPVAFALLRVFVDDELVDQKIVQDLKPGEERAFESSVFNPTEARKRLVLALYDISRRPAEVLYIREFAVVARK